MNKKSFRRTLSLVANCNIQHNGWPCNTCFHALKLPLCYNIHKYWEAVLAFRGDYPELPKQPELLKELWDAIM